MEQTPSCANCTYFQGGVFCAAYPKGIPLPILGGDMPHFESLEGYGAIPDDGGIVYEPATHDQMVERGEIRV